MENIEQQSLSGIALQHHELIPVLEKYSLDFCCRGKKTLAEACAEKKLNLQTIVSEIEQAGRSVKPGLHFAAMNAGELISYIIIHHHFYVKQAMPTIDSHIEKVATKHGERYPKMKRVLELFRDVQAELLPHMQKEEDILFPRIREIAAVAAQQKTLALPPSYISGPVAVMEMEHDHAGRLLFEIRELTNNYTPPEDACTTHMVCLEELKAFEEDLHQHVHLENNILFPMAFEMMAGYDHAKAS